LEIEAEVIECLTATSKLGGVGYVIITDGTEKTVDRRHVDVLVSALAEGTLPLQAAAYIADALIMSDNFLSFLSDESRPLLREDVQALRTRLSTVLPSGNSN
jgi:hypothetical protein